MNIDKLKEWVREGNRTVEIKIGDFNNPDYFLVKVHDYELGVTQYVTKVEEINIEKAAAEHLKRLYKATYNNFWP